MYRVVLYYLFALLGMALILGALHVVPYSPIQIVLSTLFIVALCYLANQVFSWAFDAPTNVESVYITALILALIISPLTSVTDAVYFPLAIFASVGAIASKYILAIGRKHICNPAAAGVVLTAAVLGLSASWWVATFWMVPITVIGGILMVRKIRRWDLVLSFFTAAVVSILIPTLLGSGDALSTLQHIAFISPLFFFAFVMLTEPLTTPPSRIRRIVYGAIVGVLFSPAIHIGSLYSTPELALVVGNVCSYLMSPKQKMLLRLKRRVPIAHNTYDLVFDAPSPLRFQPGQYMEWTLPHAYPDERGNRRFFTVASAPAETQVRLGVKVTEPLSSFKQKLLHMEEGDTMVAAQVAGDFVLPKNSAQKIAFIAGGIGITPFRSMIAHMLLHNDARDAVLLYANTTKEDIAYKDLFDQAQRDLGMRVAYAVSDGDAPQGTIRGRLTPDIIANTIPDYKDRTFYISGPHAMVTAFRRALRHMGVSPWRIKTDYFPGFA